MRKRLKKIGLTILILTFMYFIYVLWNLFPIITGYGAKNLCSCVLVEGRSQADVVNNELRPFPFSLGFYEVNLKDSSVTASVFGLAKRTAIYRRGVGCTLASDVSEKELRSRKIDIQRNKTYDPDTVFWPMGEKLRRSSDNRYEQLNHVVEDAFNEKSSPGKRGIRAVLVLYNGEIVSEKYANGFNKNSLHQGWSMTKSLFNNAVAGVLIKQGRIKLESRVPIDSWVHDDRSKITFGNLLNFNSGLDWDESYNKESDVTKMLYKSGEMGLYATTKKLKEQPGNKFDYSSGSGNILSMIIRQSIDKKEYHNFPYRNLYDKLGMFSLVMETDAGGTFVSSSYSMASARDWARFGLFYMNNGYWNNEQILPDGWIKYTTTPASGTNYGEYGAQFWLNAGARGNSSIRLFPDAPTDMFWAEGFQGQRLFIIPSRKIVVVRLSLTLGNPLDDDLFLKHVLESLPDKD